MSSYFAEMSVNIFMDKVTPAATNFLTFLTRRVTNSIHLLNKCIQRAVNKSLMWLDTSRTRRIIYCDGGYFLYIHTCKERSFFKDSKWMHLRIFWIDRMNWRISEKYFINSNFNELSWKVILIASTLNCFI